MSKIDSHIESALAWHQKRHKRGRSQPKGKQKPVTLSAMPTRWDRGADGPANQERLRTEPAVDIDPETGRESPNPNGVKRRRRDDWVTRYHRQGKLNHAHKAAAERLLMASEGMRERDPLAAIVAVRRIGGSDPEAARVDSRAWFREMWALVPASSKPIVERVVLADLPISRGCGKAAWDRHMLRLIAGLNAIP